MRWLKRIFVTGLTLLALLAVVGVSVGWHLSARPDDQRAKRLWYSANFKDGKFRWNRLENLLREGSKSDDYNGRDVIPPLVELIVGEDKPGEKNTLRPLVEAEVIKVVEALLLGQSVEAARSDQLAPVVALLPEQLKRLYKRYAQGTPSPHAKKHGFGLGLYIVKSYMEKMNGSVSARLHPEGGAEFSCVFPAAATTQGESS